MVRRWSYRGIGEAGSSAGVESLRAGLQEGRGEGTDRVHDGGSTGEGCVAIPQSVRACPDVCRGREVNNSVSCHVRC